MTAQVQIEHADILATAKAPFMRLRAMQESPDRHKYNVLVIPGSLY